MNLTIAIGLPASLTRWYYAYVNTHPISRYLFVGRTCSSCQLTSVNGIDTITTYL